MSLFAFFLRSQAKGAFQCHEILPRVRFGLEQSGESRRQTRDALGAGEAKDRHELGAGGLGIVLLIQQKILNRSDLAQESSGKEDSWKLETFQMEPCG